MKQHNPTGETRKCWGTARERARIKARFNIRSRVASAANTAREKGHVPVAVAVAVTTAATNCNKHDDTVKNAPYSLDTVRCILWRIVHGDRSFFSLPYMEEHALLLTARHSTQSLWQDDDDDNDDSHSHALLIGEQKLLSWFGHAQVQEFKHYIMTTRESFTVTEYTVWLRRYHILGSLLLGGVNPCVRGTAIVRTHTATTATENHSTQWQPTTGARVLGRFFDSVPLSLSSYIVDRIVRMRRLATTQTDDTACALCQRCTPIDCKLSFGSPCHHVFCEACLWDDIVTNLNDRPGDVVLCPVCCKPKIESPTTAPQTTTPTMRRQASLEKYLALPRDAHELKRLPRKKQKAHEWNALCSSWSEAVLPSLGLTRDVRRDKAFTHTEKGARHYVKGCLDAGMDVHDLRNEYGQTLLFLAAWRGHSALVQLLLDYGSDPNQTANGGFTILGAAKANGHGDIIELLRPLGEEPATSVVHPRDPLCIAPETPATTLSTLIDPLMDHPGAGSYLVDDAIQPDMVEYLLELWRTLPIEEKPKIKAVPCSVRSYFCDTERLISATLSTSLVNTQQWKDDEVTVFPHMRFLHYSEPGSTLVPHIDLCRVDALSGVRSTHSFLLYLTDCEKGGETTLLESLTTAKTLARVSPQRGRLLLFPHNCPHEGEAIVDAPKILVRGEVRLPKLGF